MASLSDLQQNVQRRSVTSSNPSTGEPVVGRIVDEVWAKEPNQFANLAPADEGWRESAFVAQLIEWPGGYRSVRITYYLRPEGSGENSWYFGGQYSSSMDLEQYRSLMAKLSEKHW